MEAKTKEIFPEQETQRGLKNRHVQLIAIAGTIGTGLFLGAGKSIHFGGPSILLVYLIIGAFMFVLLRAIGEMLYNDTEQHSFLNFMARYIGPKTGYFGQWSYWLVVIFMAMSELTAVGVYIQLWLPHVPTVITETVILVLLFGLNTLNAKFFGETEFWFGMIKIAAIVGMIVTAVIMLFGNFHYSTSSVTGAAQLSNLFGARFSNGWGNFFASFQMIMFAFVGMEFIGMTAAETDNPQPTLKKAINQIPVRIMLFYIGALLAIMLIVPWDKIQPGKSPFVMVFELVGVKWAANLINFVVITSAASALNSCLFSTTRNLYALSNIHKDKIMTPFTKLSKRGIPLNALIFTAILVFLTPFISMIPGVSDGFTFVTSVATNLFLVVYIMTLWTFLKFRKSKEFNPEGFTLPGGKILAPVAIIGFLLIFLSLFFYSDTRIPAIGTVVWIIVFGLISHFRKPKEN
ncbi:MAG: amino acid permease [Streptococcaceae bacterium]|jgi:L-asparagine transporter-like permease|nr:amino acid permease [Streptococcaceae bacterium]